MSFYMEISKPLFHVFWRDLGFIGYSYIIMSMWTQAQTVAWAFHELQCWWRENLIPPPPVQRMSLLPAAWSAFVQLSLSPACTHNALQWQHLPEFGQRSWSGVVERAHTMGSKDWRGATGSPGWLQGGGKGDVPLVGLWPMPCWALQPLPLTPVDVTAHTKVTCSRHAS